MVLIYSYIYCGDLEGYSFLQTLPRNRSPIHNKEIIFFLVQFGRISYPSIIPIKSLIITVVPCLYQHSIMIIPQLLFLQPSFHCNVYKNVVQIWILCDGANGVGTALGWHCVEMARRWHYTLWARDHEGEERHFMGMAGTLGRGSIYTAQPACMFWGVLQVVRKGKGQVESAIL